MCMQHEWNWAVGLLGSCRLGLSCEVREGKSGIVLAYCTVRQRLYMCVYMWGMCACCCGVLCDLSLRTWVLRA